jgi:hypothetical protein
MNYIILYNSFKMFNNMKRQREEQEGESTNKKHKTAPEITDTDNIEAPFVELIITKENFKDALAKIKDKGFPVHSVKLEGISNPQQFELLIKAIGSKPTITSLNLSGNYINCPGAQKIVEALKGNTTLIYLYLADNFIGDKGAAVLAEMLKINTTLTHLDLKNNSIEHLGAGQIAAALKINTTLISFDLSGNFIGCLGAQKIAEALEVNTTLIYLYLEDNFINYEGSSALTQVLENNLHLTELIFPGSDIQDLLKRNEDIFSEMVKTIENPAANVKGWHCKFFQEAPGSIFHEALGLNNSTYISNFKNIISWNFLFFSGVCKTVKTSGLPDDLWAEIANYLKIRDISWDYEKSDTSSSLLGSNDNAEPEC